MRWRPGARNLVEARASIARQREPDDDQAEYEPGAVGVEELSGQLGDVRPRRAVRRATQQHVNLLGAIVIPIPASIAWTTTGEIAKAARCNPAEPEQHLQHARTDGDRASHRPAELADETRHDDRQAAAGLLTCKG